MSGGSREKHIRESNSQLDPTTAPHQEEQHRNASRASSSQAERASTVNFQSECFRHSFGNTAAQWHKVIHIVWLLVHLLRLLSHSTSNKHGRNRRVLFHQLEQRIGLRFGEACHHRMHLRLLLAELFVLEPLIAPTKGLCQLCNEFLVLGLYPFNWLGSYPFPHANGRNCASSSGIRSCPPCESLPTSSWDSPQ